MNLYLTIFLLVSAALAQSSLAPHLSWRGLRPDLVLIFVVSWGLIRGVREGAIWGFIGGISLDLLSASPLGLSAIVLTLMGLLAGIARRGLYRRNLLFPLAAILLATLIYNSLFLLAWRSLGHTVAWSGAFSYLFPPSVLLNMLLTLPLYPFLFWLHRRFGRARLEL